MKAALTATPSVARFAPIAFRGGAADAFALASELDFNGVELHLRHASDVDKHELRRLMDGTGLGVPTLGTGMAAGEDGLTFAAADSGVRGAAVERVRGHVDLASEVGSMVTIGVVSGRLGHGEDRDERRASAIECLAETCRYALERGVGVLLEPLNRYECDWVNTLDDGMAVIEEAGMPNLKLLADTFHENIEEADISASMKRAAHCLGHVHLVDTNRQAPGYGHLDVRGVLETLSGIGYDSWISLEILPIPDSRQALIDGLTTIRAASTAD